MASRKPDDRIKGQQRLTHNKVCFDCAKTGLMPDVCLTFGIFVCALCSSIHREFGHRINTVSVTSFNAVQAQTIEDNGNAKVREEYLKSFPESRRPTPGNAEQIRAFIRDVFVNRLYANKNESDVAKPEQKPVKVPSPAPTRPASNSFSKQPASQPKPPAAPVAPSFDPFNTESFVESKVATEPIDTTQALAKILSTYMAAHSMSVSTLEEILPRALQIIHRQVGSTRVETKPAVAAATFSKPPAPAVPLRKPAAANEDALFGSQFDAVFGDDDEDSVPEKVAAQNSASVSSASHQTADVFATFGGPTVANTHSKNPTNVALEKSAVSIPQVAFSEDPFGSDPFAEPEQRKTAVNNDFFGSVAATSAPQAKSNNDAFSFNTTSISPLNANTANHSASAVQSNTASSIFDSISSSNQATSFGASSGPVSSSVSVADDDDDDIFGSAMKQSAMNSGQFGSSVTPQTNSSIPSQTSQPKTNAFKFNFGDANADDNDDDDDDGVGGNPFDDAPKGNNAGFGFGASNTGVFGAPAMQGMQSMQGSQAMQFPNTGMNNVSSGMNMGMGMGAGMGMGVGMNAGSNTAQMMNPNQQFQQMMMQSMAQTQAGQMNPMQQQQMMQLLAQQQAMARQNQGFMPTQPQANPFGVQQNQHQVQQMQQNNKPSGQNTNSADIFAGAFQM